MVALLMLKRLLMVSLYIELGEEEQKVPRSGRTTNAILGKKVNEMLENSGKNK